MPLAVDPAHFVTLDRQDEVSRIGVETSVLIPDQYSNTPADVAIRLDVHGQYVGENGWGFYGSLPAEYANNIPWGVGVGDTELGGLYVVHAGDGFTLVPHASFVVATGGTSRGGAAALYAAAPSRLTDIPSRDRGHGGLRAGISPLLRAGAFFARIDLDVYKTGSVFLQVNAGAGVTFGRLAVMAESVNYSFVPDIFIIDGGAVSVRWSGERFSPYGAVVFGLDSTARAYMDAAVTIGLECGLR